MVVVLPWNDPLRVIEQTVVLDYLADGRFLLGIGKGEARASSAASAWTSTRAAAASRRTSTSCSRRSSAACCGARASRTSRSARRRAPFKDRVLMAAGSPQSLDRAADTGLPLLRIVLRSWEEVAEQVERHAERFAAAVG